MGDHLDGFSQIVSPAFLVYDCLVNLTRGHGVVPGGMDAGKPFVVTQIQVCLHTVVGHIALSVLVGIERARVYIDIRVEFLDGYPVTTTLKESSDAGRDNSFSQGGDHASRYKDVFCLHFPVCFKNNTGHKIRTNSRFLQDFFGVSSPAYKSRSRARNRAA